MEIKITYSKLQLDKAVSFIKKRNNYFLNKPKEIRSIILDKMHHLAENRNLSYVGTLGCLLIPECIEEDMEHDSNTCHIEIYVDPQLGYEPDDVDADWQETVLTVSPEEYFKND